MHRWKDEPWWKRAVVYQIYVRSFHDSNGDGIGDLNGIREKLPYLSSLGIDAIYLNPINTSSNDDNGYDISDFYGIMEEYGTPEDFDALIEEAGRYGIRVIMDIVLNHSSDEHPWFESARQSRGSEFHDYYIWRDEPNNWLSFFGGSAWEYNDATEEYYLHIFSKKMPDFNYENENLRKKLGEILLYWKSKGVAGVRLDAINHLAKDTSFRDANLNEDGSPDFIRHIQNLPLCHTYLKELREPVLSEDFPFMGEAGGIGFSESHIFTAPSLKELDLLFHFDYHSLGIDYSSYSRRDFNLVEEFKRPFFGWSDLKDDQGWNPVFWSNHDTTRTISRICRDSIPCARLLALLQMTMRGTPFIYYGDEIGMTDGDFSTIDDFKDVAVRNNYRLQVEKGDMTKEEYLRRTKLTNRDNGRTPMQWNNEVNAGFTTSEPWIRINSNFKYLNAERQDSEEDSLLNTYRRLIEIRKTSPTLVFGDTEEILHNNGKIIGYIRRDEDKEPEYLILGNFSKKEVRLRRDDIPAGDYEMVFSVNNRRTVFTHNDCILLPYEGIILRINRG